jgi:hypothetical protein
LGAAIEKGRKYNPYDFNPYHFTSRSMGIDPAWGSSAFGIVVTQWIDNHIQIVHAEEYHRPDYNEMLSTVNQDTLYHSMLYRIPRHCLSKPHC